MKDIRCLLGIHDWVYQFTVIRSCGSELEKRYRCSRCNELLCMGCDTSYEGCINFRFPSCVYHPDNIDEECPKMKRRKS